MRAAANGRISAFLRVLRQSHGLKQREVAASAGITQVAISNIERRGTTPETESKYLTWVRAACVKKYGGWQGELFS